MLAPEIVPSPLVTVQVCPVGCVFTVTEYEALSAMAVANVKLVESVAIVRSSVKLFCKTKPSVVSPEIVPPIVKPQEMVIFVMLAL